MEKKWIESKWLKKNYEFDAQKDLIIEGGFGKIYKVKDLKTSQIMALKVATFSDEDSYEREKEEIPNMLSLDHENIIKLRNNNNDKLADDYWVIYMVFDYAKDGNLKQFLSTHPLTENGALDIALQLAKGLTYAHSKNVFHLDLVERNVLNFFPTFKLADWGSGKRKVDNKTNKIDPGKTKVAWSIYPPEFERDEDIKFSKVDVYAFGILLMNLLAKCLAAKLPGLIGLALSPNNELFEVNRKFFFDQIFLPKKLNFSMWEKLLPKMLTFTQQERLDMSAVLDLLQSD